MSEKIDTGGPAFPVSTAEASVGHQDGPNTWQFPGMTLRDYFAAKAMQSILDSGHHFNIERSIVSKAVAELAYYYADAMLKAREVKNGQG